MSKSCLIVDDSHVVRKITRRIMTDLGFECAEADDGKAALEACKTAMPDVILLDWNMPNMDGITCLEKLRANKKGKQPAVIFCTIENDVERIKRAMDAGADEYIMKPFDRDILRSKLMIAGCIS